MLSGPHAPPPTLTRRNLLEWLGAGTALALGGDLLAACRALAREPRGSDASMGLSFQPGKPAGSLFREWWVRTIDRQDLNAILSSWRLEVGGLVDRPEVLSFAEFLALPHVEQVTDFHCVEGWSVPDVPWRGVWISDLLDRAGAKPRAAYVHFRTVLDRYNESLPLAVARERRSLLAYGVAGSTLPLDHGFPLRVVVPRLFGYKNAKYVYRVELSAEPLRGYWVQNGYDYGGEVPAAGLRPGKY
jgi:DMSO/TMAO reductase YedYZ molybdopterin-dependent catalytic subunit